MTGFSAVVFRQIANAALKSLSGSFDPLYSPRAAHSRSSDPHQTGAH
jgi:hypothetical protein